MSIFHGRGYRCSPFRPDMIWDPFRDFPAGPPIPAAFVNAWNFRNWETPEAHFFQADLQGLKGDEIKVETEEGNVLRISGEKKVDKEEKSDAWHRMEHSSGRFLRRYKLPDNANLDKTKASMENGALTVIVPKTETYTNTPSMRPIHIN